MKKSLIITLLLLVTYVVPSVALAQSSGQLLNDINPLNNQELKADGVTVTEDITKPGGFISRILSFAFPIAGLVLFVMIFWGGFEVLVNAGAKKSVDAGKQRITAAVVGFFLLFISYWLIRVLEAVFGLRVFDPL